MSIEAGARAGLIAPDETTFEYLRGRPGAPEDWEAAVERWRQLPTDPDAAFDRELEIDVSEIRPQATGARTPAWSSRSTASCPIPKTSPTRTIAPPPSGHSRTWRSSLGRRSRRSA